MNRVADRNRFEPSRKNGVGREVDYLHAQDTAEKVRVGGREYIV